ncbi:MAG: cyclase family protein [Acidobacteriota bacterium]
MRLFGPASTLFLLASLVAAASAGLLGGPAAHESVLDLGHPLSESDPSWTGERVFGRTALGTVEEDGYAMGKFFSDEHFGTHLDAPSHFAAGGWTVDQIPPSRLVRPGVCINVEAKAREDDDYRLSLEDVKAFEATEGAIPEGAVVLVATGWDRRWARPDRYMNSREGVKHFPGISVEAATYLARERKVAGIGIDTPSVDYGPSTDFETHRATMPENVYHIENAARLTALPPRGFTVVVAPIYLAGGTGGPTRVFALLP